ncbi:MAG: hypothetical protein Q9212_002740 [Teloschistes hypoglaucus]
MYTALFSSSIWARLGLLLLCIWIQSSDSLIVENHDLSGIQHPTKHGVATVVSSTSAAQIGLPFGNQHFTPNFTLFERRGPQVKRGLDFQSALCKGQKLWKMLVDEYERTPTPDDPPRQSQVFTKEDLANGWSFYKWPQPPPIGAIWDQTFRDIAGGRIYDQLNPQRISIKQDKMFRNKFGALVRVSLSRQLILPFSQDVRFGMSLAALFVARLSIVVHPLSRNKQALDDADGRPFLLTSVLEQEIQVGATYSAYYTASPGTIIATNIRSPSSEVKEEYPDISPADLERSVPALSRFSDAAWTIWSLIISPDQVNNLRYIGHESVSNPDTLAIMGHILTTTREQNNVPWPGLSFGMDSDEGKALLGTPNGLGTAWLLYDRYEQLGRRAPKVTIWTDVRRMELYDFVFEDVFWYMLWELGDA